MESRMVGSSLVPKGNSRNLTTGVNVTVGIADIFAAFLVFENTASINRTFLPRTNPPTRGDDQGVMGSQFPGGPVTTGPGGTAAISHFTDKPSRISAGL